MNVIPFCPCQEVAPTLRRIADDVEQGIYKGDATIIIGKEVFHVGKVHSDDAAREAIWNMTFGIHKLMRAGLSKIKELEEHER